ncbi:MAG: dihydrolipoamide acetyltransferase component of pyruvate dehydrogenase complex [Litorilinea sp.]|nr:MAG: dihydrolipoamide acetyltransferase component of pyruvate dehydrogenase complex [Litorilinea sp.]
MAIEVKLPDMGEGTEEVTISRWLVQEGDEVQEGDILLEVATDKVDTEVPAPASGKVLKLNYAEGELVPVDAVLAVLGEEGEEVSAAPAAPAAEEAEEAEEAPAEPEAAAPTAARNGQSVKASPVAKRVAAEKGIALDTVPGTGPGGRITKEDVLASADGSRRQVPAGGEPLPGELADVASLPVRRLAAEYNIDLEEIAGGRPLSSLTKYDVLSAVASREAGHPVTVEPAYPLTPPARPSAAPSTAPAAPAPAKAAPAAAPAAEKAAPAQLGPGEELVKHSRMRLAIARNTSASLFTAPHVTTMWDVDMSAVLAHRKAHKDEFARAGVNLTITAYLIEAIVAGLKAVPAANATWTDEGVIIKRYYNIGMAVALPPDEYGMGGLIVPVIKNAGELNLMGIARRVNELAEKARKGQLSQDDLQGGTFTLSNYGTSGSRFQTPVIVQPQVGILGVGAIEKRPVVVSQGHPLEANTGDYLAFLPMTTLGFSYDHRVLDGATADAFCAAVKKALESYGQ